MPVLAVRLNRHFEIGGRRAADDMPVGGGADGWQVGPAGVLRYFVFLRP